MPVHSLPSHAVLATLSTRSGVRAVVFEPSTPVPYTRPSEVGLVVKGGQIAVNGVVVGTVAEAHAIDPTFDPLNWAWTIPKPKPTAA